jgi:C-terminal processing protease CtpA/Prc
VVLGFSRLLALLNDSHSTINLLQANTGIRRYPISFRWQSDGLFVTAAPETQAHLVGGRVLTLNGRPTEAVYEALRPWQSHDTESWYRYASQAALSVHDLYVAAALGEDGAPLTIEVERPDGAAARESIPLASVSTVEGPIHGRFSLPSYRKLTNQDYWFEILPEQRALYIQYNRCRENALLSIRAFASEIIAAAAEAKPERWIVDVRENSGGSSVFFQRLLQHLGEAVTAGAFPFPARGAVGIIGKRTFSSGSLAVRDMQQAGFLLVGETTGGRVFWFGENLPWTLPHSRLSLTVSTRLIGDPNSGPAVIPDYPVPFTGADYFANRDPFLAKALEAEAPARLP